MAGLDGLAGAQQRLRVPRIREALVGYCSPMTPPKDVLGYRLDNAPVHRVVLEIQYATSMPVQARHLWPFFSAIVNDYSEVTEGPPIASGQKIEYEIVPEGDFWPIPRTHFVSEQRDLYVQGDELALGWHFNEGESTGEYVGFDALVSELKEAYDRVERQLASEDVEITPYNVTCYYSNRISELTVSQLISGIFTGWQSVDSCERPVVEPSTTDASSYVGMRMHHGGVGEHSRHEIVTMIDANHDDSPRLSFNVSTSVESDESPFDALRSAHDCLIDKFKSTTSDDLRKGWGE